MTNSNAMMSHPTGDPENSSMQRPEAQSHGSSEPGAGKKQYKPLLIMLCLFSLPYFISWYYLFSDDPIIEVGTNNKGLLVSPMRPIDELAFQSKIAQFKGIDDSAPQDKAVVLTNTEERSSGTMSWRDKWTMVTVIEGTCGDNCRKTLFHMGQIRKAMGVNRDKVHRVALLTNSIDESRLNKLLSDYTGTEFVLAPQSNIDRLLTQLSGITPTLANGIYLIDPKANYMMAYAADMPAKYLLDDMERLFKVNK